MPELRPRPFKSVTRTIDPLGRWVTLLAICIEGRAWLRIVGNDEAPDIWTELKPLPDPLGIDHE